MIIEVVSPFNPNNDYIRKLSLYDQYKVHEYWIINPMNLSTLVYRQDQSGLYTAPDMYTFIDKIPVGIFEDLYIDFNDISLE